MRVEREDLDFVFVTFVSRDLLGLLGLALLSFLVVLDGRTDFDLLLLVSLRFMSPLDDLFFLVRFISNPLDSRLFSILVVFVLSTDFLVREGRSFPVLGQIGVVPVSITPLLLGVVPL